MRVRAIRDLTQLADPAFFAAIAEGLGLVVKNIGRLYDGAATLAEAKQPHPARVLALIAEEEAAKLLILMDAVRCPRLPPERLARQLSRFNDHLAKGLYAKACTWCPATIEQLQEYVNHDRREFYLDGPNDVDWIFRNEVIQGREGALYVDYVANDDTHNWSDPAQFEDLIFSTPEPWSVTTARHLYDAGISTPDAVAVVAEVWRSMPTEPGTRFNRIQSMNRHTLTLLESRGLLKDQPASTYSWIVEQWQFPMYDLDLSMIPVKLETLREQQRNWSPEY